MRHHLTPHLRITQDGDHASATALDDPMARADFATAPPEPARPAAPEAAPRRNPGPEPEPRAWSWARSAIDSAWTTLAALGGHSRADDALHAFAEVIEQAREPAEVQVALVRMAHEVSGAQRVELEFEVDGRPIRMATWPGPGPATGRAEPAHPAAAAPAHEPGRWVRIPCRAAGRTLGMLKLREPSERAWSPWTFRRLATLVAMASSAELALRGGTFAASPRDVEVGLQPATFLDGFLPFCLAQARRRRESLTLLDISIDRLAAIRDLHGTEFASEAVRRVGRAVVAALRVSDVVIRLDDGRLIAVLPNAGIGNAQTVAEAVRSTIAESGVASTSMPILTATIGVATFPDHAHDAASLRAAAAGAQGRASRQGRDRVAIAEAAPSPDGRHLARSTG